MVSTGGQPNATAPGGIGAPPQETAQPAADEHPLAPTAAEEAATPAPCANAAQALNGKRIDPSEAKGFMAASTGAQRPPQSPASPASPPSAAAAATAHAHADAKLLAEIRSEMERQRGKMTLERRRQVAARLLEHKNREDTFFTRLSRRLRQAGVELPAVTVEYRGLRVETEALVGSASIPTVLSVPLTAAKKLLHLHNGREARPLTILNDIQGRLVPGRLTLLLGPPSCGKSSFMRALTGRLMPAQGKQSGDVRYNGAQLDEFNVRRTAAYVDQIDNHNPNLTVRETLDFAHACQVGLHGATIDVPAELAAQRLASRAAHHHQDIHNDGGAHGGESVHSTGVPASAAAAAAAAHGSGTGQGHSHYGASQAGSAATPRGGAGPGDAAAFDQQQQHGHGHDHGHGQGEQPQQQHSHQPHMGSMKAAMLKSLRNGRHDSKALLDQAEPEDEFEALLRQAWGTNVRVDIVMSLLGLAHCSETLVGDALVRGISGGERKRLTAAEMLVGPSNVIMLDEMSTGLDSATLFTVVRWLSQAAQALRLTIMVSLLQPPPEVFGLFDDVILMTEGRVLYHGPVPDVVPHFRSLGLECPDRKDVPSFLLEITTPLGQRQFAGPELRQRFNLPPPGVDLVPASRSESQALPAEGDLAAANLSNGSAPVSGDGSVGRRKFHSKSLLIPLKEMESAFWTNNKHGVAMAAELNDAPSPLPMSTAAKGAVDGSSGDSSTSSASSGQPPAPLVPLSSRYALRPLEAVAVATRRQVTLVMRDKVLLKGRLIQVTVLGLLTGSLFYNQGVSMVAARTLFGCCFMSVLFMSFGGFPQIPITLEQKKVWFKHRSSAFYPAYAQGLAMALSQLPLSFIESGVFAVVIYFMTNFYREPGYFFTFYLVLACTSMAVSSLFRFLACVSPNMVIANALSGLAIVTLILTSGFAIVHYSIPPWAIWAYWISPHAYALRSLVINEMVSPKWQNVPAPPGVQPPGLSLGDAALETFNFYTTRDWIWIGVGFLIGFYIVLTFLSIVILAYQEPEVPPAQLADPEEVARARARAEALRERFAKVPAKSGRHKHSKPHKGEMVVVVDKSEGAKSDRTSGGDNKSRDGNGSDSNGQLVLSPSMAALQDYIDISSSLPFTPITLVFQDLKYWVPNPYFSRRAARAAAKAASDASQAAIDAHAAGKDVEEGNAAGGNGHGAAASPGGGGGSPVNAAAGQPGNLPLEARERLQLLSGITGFNEPGVLLALMGGSGAGKTTLMDVIAGRKTVGEIGGTITVNGHKAEPRAWSRVMGYVEQFDIHTPAQTVVEALQFSARLRLPPSFTDTQVKAYVDEVMEIVDLTPLLYNLVGTAGVSGLSTEARKRLTIAVELVANPSCLFLDEPTSGLDARAAAIVMRAVRNVARNGRTVMVTIHQPSIEIFESFDQLLLIQRGGRTTYFGPLGLHSADLINYFMAVPGTPPLPSGFNPATWMLEVTGGSMATVLDKVELDWPEHYAATQLAKQNEARAHELVDAKAKTCQPLEVGSQYAMPFWTQTRVLLRKFNLAYWRTPSYNFVRMGMTFITSFIYLAVYWGEGHIPNPAGIANVQNVMGIMFSSSNFLGMTNLMSVMPVVGYERVVFYRERGASMYDAFAYGIAIALVEMPYLLVQACTFVPIIYFGIGFELTAEAFWYYFIVFFETIVFYTIFGQTLVYITPAQAIAQVVGGGFNFLFNVFNGFIITYPEIPRGWKWMNRAVPATWILYGLGVSQLGNNNETLIYAGQSMTVSQFMKTRFGYSYDMRWWIVLILLAYILAFRVGSILALKYWNHLKR
ncbi:hypothetical protein HYH02_003189 [Chlamydomonas schloesseri]|uniref:ABC transporter domain-containing protein n=1 Tax=Chlamydomonas schloesseri TaxID=2026947 RepID=A0A835WQQ4_9CHLO|nr:hypothetical protein HYH02_003189 [Chlamydomonas schloesseri]|eukprot:KAG2452157.1 hypothetical protein HYH02_003189 [Chlamydomonas schloesseri]